MVVVYLSTMQAVKICPVFVVIQLKIDNYETTFLNTIFVWVILVNLYTIKSLDDTRSPYDL